MTAPRKKAAKKKAPKKKAGRRGPATARTGESDELPGTGLVRYVPDFEDGPRRPFTDSEREMLGEQLADIFEKAGTGPFVDARQAKRPERPGRPPKLTAERALTILRAIAHQGAAYNAACALAGIDYNTFKRWRQNGAVPGSEPLYRLFRAALARATALSEGSLTELMHRHATADYRAAAWLLERRFPKRYGPPAVTLKGDKDAPAFPTSIEFRLVPASAPPGVTVPAEDGAKKPLM